MDTCFSLVLGMRDEVMPLVSSEFCVVFTTFESKAEADLFAENAVSRRLAACVNVVGPVASTYWWRGVREKTEEFLALAKTSETRVQELVAELKRDHSYELPEVTVLKVSGSREYVDWVMQETQREEP